MQTVANNKVRKIYPWVVVGLLWVVALLNYMDRQMLSVMKDVMQVDIAELRMAENFGRLMAVFLWIYGIVSPFAGAIADRLSRKWLIIVSLCVWSVVTLLMGYCNNFTQLYWLRALMGVSEALYIPAALSLIADYHTGSTKSMAIGIHMTGLYIGQAIGGFGAAIAVAMTWQSTFRWIGLIGVVYAFVLVFLLREKRGNLNFDEDILDGEENYKYVKKSGTEFLKKLSVSKGFALLLTNISFWIILFYFASLSLPGWATKNWLPTLFAEGLNIPMPKAGPMSTITIAAASFIGVLVGGPLSDFWVKRNIKGRIYTSAIGISLMIPSLLLLGLGSGTFAAITAGVLFGVGFGMFDTNNMPILCQFVPSNLRATAYGIMNMIGVFSGALCTQILGKLADAGYLGLSFALMGGITLIALILQLTVLKPVTDNAS